MSEENTTEAVEEEVKEVKAPSVTEVKATDTCREPNPATKKGLVFGPGRTKEGGSISGMAAEFGCTTSNIRQHIAQCHTNLGFGYKVEGDTYFITGEVTESWADQAAVKATKAADKAAEKKAADEAKAAEAPEAPTETEAEAPVVGEDEEDFLDD